MPKNLLNDEELKQLVMGSEYLSGAKPTPQFATDHVRPASTRRAPPRAFAPLGSFLANPFSRTVRTDRLP